jgi:hypothetical protein
VFDSTGVVETPSVGVVVAYVLSCPCPKLGGADGNCVACDEKGACETYKTAVEKGKELSDNNTNLLPS